MQRKTHLTTNSFVTAAKTFE